MEIKADELMAVSEVAAIPERENNAESDSIWHVRIRRVLDRRARRGSQNRPQVKGHVGARSHRDLFEFACWKTTRRNRAALHAIASGEGKARLDCIVQEMYLVTAGRERGSPDFRTA